MMVMVITLMIKYKCRSSVDPGKKESHNKCEQKGRQKINDKINELKDLIPECQNTASNKASILHSTGITLLGLASDLHCSHCVFFSLILQPIP
jgi:hypothetical protein